MLSGSEYEASHESRPAATSANIASPSSSTVEQQHQNTRGSERTMDSPGTLRSPFSDQGSQLSYGGVPEPDLIYRGIEPVTPLEDPPYAEREKTLFAATLAESHRAMAKLGDTVRENISSSTIGYDSMTGMNNTIYDSYYSEFTDTASNKLLYTMNKVRSNFQTAEEFSNLIFDVERQVSMMEAVINELDSYTFALEEAARKRTARLAAASSVS